MEPLCLAVRPGCRENEERPCNTTRAVSQLCSRAEKVKTAQEEGRKKVQSNCLQVNEIPPASL